MLHRLAAGAHRLWVLVKATLHIFKNLLVFPPGDNALLGCRALLAKFAVRAFSGRVSPIVQAIGFPLVPGEQQDLFCRADIHVVLGHIAKVGFDEEAFELVVRGLRLRQRDRDIGVGAFEDLFTAEVPAISNDIEFIDAEVNRLGNTGGCFV